MQKTFILATLVSTIIGTFTTGLGLYERVGQKRKQQKTDGQQDAKIKALEADVKRAEEKSKSGKGGQKQIQDGDVKESLGESGPMIRREYDRNVYRLGDRFADGDGELWSERCAMEDVKLTSAKR